MTRSNNSSARGAARLISVGLILGSNRVVALVRLLFLPNEPVLEHEQIQIRPHEASIRILRSAHDRLAADVERRVDENRTAGLRMERGENPPEIAVAMLIDRVHARAV